MRNVLKCGSTNDLRALGLVPTLQRKAAACDHRDPSKERQMANPKERHEAAPSAVASCSATDCTYNENRECHAGEIQVEMSAQRAICGTYSPRKPKARP